MRLRLAGTTDVGRARQQNEDAFYLCRQEGLCVVADGMGGHNSGKVASNMAIEQIAAFYERTARSAKPSSAKQSQRLVASVRTANREIFKASATADELRGMGTTIVCARFGATGVWIAHVGDSRCYRIRNGKLKQVSEDHSLANEYVRAGILRLDEVPYFPYRHVITRAVGLSDDVDVDVRFHRTKPDDMYLLCSDGLSDLVDDPLILDTVQAADGDIDDACIQLVNTANEFGGHDNVTAVMAQVIKS